MRRQSDIKLPALCCPASSCTRCAPGDTSSSSAKGSTPTTVPSREDDGPAQSVSRSSALSAEGFVRAHALRPPGPRVARREIGQRAADVIAGLPAASPLASAPSPAQGAARASACCDTACAARRGFCHRELRRRERTGRKSGVQNQLHRSSAISSRPHRHCTFLFEVRRGRPRRRIHSPARSHRDGPPMLTFRHPQLQHVFCRPPSTG